MKDNLRIATTMIVTYLQASNRIDAKQQLDTIMNGDIDTLKAHIEVTIDIFNKALEELKKVSEKL